MAKKRLTDVDKWKKQFFRNLPCEYKLFWIYLLDDCDHCGIWHVDLEIAEIKLGIKLSLEKARGLFSERVVELDGGTKWFVPDFISFQYGELSEKNTMYKSVVPTLRKYNLMGDKWGIYPPKVKEQVKEQVKETEGGLGETITFPIENCLQIAIGDERWVRATGATTEELGIFNTILEQLAEYRKNPADYKRHFANLKRKYPERFRKEVRLSTEELRQMAKQMTKNEAV